MFKMVNLVACMSAISVLCASSVQAAFFSNSTAFNAANPGLVPLTFNCAPGPFCPVPSLTGVAVSGPLGGMGPTLADAASFGAPSDFLADNDFGGFLSFVFAPDVTAVGFNLAAGLVGGNLTVSVFNSANVLLQTMLVTAPPTLFFTSFAGFSGLGDIDRLLVTTNSNPTLFVAIDNLQFGTPIPSEVPEPASLALLAVGLAGLGVARRKQ